MVTNKQTQPKSYTSPKLCKTLTGEVVQRKSRKHAYDALEDANGLDGVRPFLVQREDRLHAVTSPVNTVSLGQSTSPLGTMHLSAFDVRLMPLAYILHKSHCPQRPTAATTQKTRAGEMLSTAELLNENLISIHQTIRLCLG